MLGSNTEEEAVGGDVWTQLLLPSYPKPFLSYHIFTIFKGQKL